MATRGVIRRLWAGERDQVRDHLLRLDGEDRALRFGGYASTALIAEYCEKLDWSRALVIGYIAGGEVRGLGQLELIGAGWPRAAEFAVSVERPFQNRGVGTALLRRLVIAARNRLIAGLHDLSHRQRPSGAYGAPARWRSACRSRRGRGPDRAALADAMDVAGGAAVRARVDRGPSSSLAGSGATRCCRRAPIRPVIGRRARGPAQVMTEGASRPVRARISPTSSAIRINGCSATCGS